MPRVLVLPDWVVSSRHGLHTPDQKAFGVNYFSERGYDPLVIANRGRLASGITRHMPRKHGVPIAGDLVPQLTALRRQGEFDLVYAPWSQRYALLLRTLRALGVLRRPIVCLVHSPLPPEATHGLRGIVARLAFRGSDALACISSAVADGVRDLHWRSGSIEVVSLGPDAGFYAAPDYPGEGFVAAGISWRDLELFGRAASEANVPATIVCPDSRVTPAFAGFGANVTVTRPVPFEALLPLYRSARALAVPLQTTHYQRGLWGLFDGLASGKAVIMTRSPLVDIDIEGLGAGIWIDPGDKDGWVSALRRLQADPDEATTMGRRGRTIVDGGLDSRAFAHQLMDLFDSMLGIDTRRHAQAATPPSDETDPR